MTCVALLQYKLGIGNDPELKSEENMSPHLFSKALDRSRQLGVREELFAQLKRCRQYLSNARNGAYDYLNSYPCGYQDAHVDKVQAMFESLEVLKLAYAIRYYRHEKLERYRAAMRQAIG